MMQMIKKPPISGIIILTIFLSVASCEKDKPISEAILGKWEVATLNQVTYENNVRKAELILYFGAEEMVYYFIDGGSGIFYEKDEDYLFSWELTGNILTIKDLYKEDMVVDISVDDDVLSWTYNETDPENPSLSYEFIVTSNRIK